MPKMKSSYRAAFIALGLVILLLVLLTKHLVDLGNQYSASAYLQASLANTFFHTPPDSPPSVAIEAGDKIVVMAKMESEDTDWVSNELPSFVDSPPLSNIS